MNNPIGLRPGEFFIAVNPAVEDAAYAALDLAQQGALDEAQGQIEEIHWQHPLNHVALSAMGVIHALKGEHPQCLEYVDKALARYPNFVEAQFNMAVAYQTMLNVGKAIRAFRRVEAMGAGASLTDIPFAEIEFSKELRRQKQNKF